MAQENQKPMGEERPEGYAQVNTHNEDERDHFRNAGGDPGNQYGDSPAREGEQYRQSNSDITENNAPLGGEGGSGLKAGDRREGGEGSMQYSNIRYGGGHAQGRQFETGEGENSSESGSWPEDPAPQGGNPV